MEQIVKHPSFDTQQELLRRYCKEAEALLTKATDMNDASRIKEEACERFQQECNSSLLVNATKDYIDQIIARMWQNKGRPGEKD